jgi:hypothetical protein
MFHQSQPLVKSSPLLIAANALHANVLALAAEKVKAKVVVEWVVAIHIQRFQVVLTQLLTAIRTRIHATHIAIAVKGASQARAQVAFAHL